MVVSEMAQDAAVIDQETLQIAEEISLFENCSWRRDLQWAEAAEAVGLVGAVLRFVIVVEIVGRKAEIVSRAFQKDWILRWIGWHHWEMVWKKCFELFFV